MRHDWEPEALPQELQDVPTQPLLGRAFQLFTSCIAIKCFPCMVFVQRQPTGLKIARISNLRRGR